MRAVLLRSIDECIRMGSIKLYCRQRKLPRYPILNVFHGQNKHKSNDDNTSYHRRFMNGTSLLTAFMER
jgi:hypothetical protein